MSRIIKNMAIGYDIMGGDDNAHDRMIKVMEKDLGAENRLETLWTMRTDESAQKLRSRIKRHAVRRKVQADVIDLWIAPYSEPDECDLPIALD